MKWFQQRIGSLERHFLSCLFLNANPLRNSENTHIVVGSPQSRRPAAAAAAAAAAATLTSACLRMYRKSQKEISSHLGSVASMRRLLLIFALCCATRALQPSNLGDDELSALACACPAAHFSLLPAFVTLTLNLRPHPSSAFVRHQLAQRTHRAERAPSSKLEMCVHGRLRYVHLAQCPVPSASFRIAVLHFLFSSHASPADTTSTTWTMAMWARTLPTPRSECAPSFS